MIDGLMMAQAVPAQAAVDYWSMLFVFVLATFIGLGVIRRVSRLLYTPLMSLTNAISAIAVVGSIVVAGADYPQLIRILRAVALFALMTHIVSGFRMRAIVAEVILGFLTFTGSLMAAGKLQEVKWIPQRPVTYPGQNVVNVGVLVTAAALGVLVVVHPTAAWSGQVFYAIAGLAVLFGVLL